MASEPIQLRAVDPAPVACKVCDAPAPLFGGVDFNRSCEDEKGAVLPPAGLVVPYRRCDGCGLIFTDAFDDWGDADFLRHIYNDAYIAVDPDFAHKRPQGNAAMLARGFRSAAPTLDVLDYGGGNGLLARLLAQAGFPDPQTYDRFHPAHRVRPAGRFSLVTCFETLEHMPDPVAGAADIVSFLQPDGLLFLSTLVQPPDILTRRLDWWYAGPRNGHVTLFTHRALALLFGRFGLRLYATASPNFHFLCRAMPPFARHALNECRLVEA